MPQLDLITYQSQAIYLSIVFIISYVLLEMFLVNPLYRLIKLRLYLIQECNIPELKIYYSSNFLSIFFSLIQKLTKIVENLTFYSLNIFDISSFLKYNLISTTNNKKYEKKKGINKVKEVVIPELSEILEVKSDSSFASLDSYISMMKKEEYDYEQLVQMDYDNAFIHELTLEDRGPNDPIIDYSIEEIEQIIAEQDRLKKEAAEENERRKKTKKGTKRKKK